ncbi:hypothetical protein C8R46DRAFT_1071309 [Mycena filopes]|nr:hypothetical protein C8R46DRAFT_1071309 [Mycena filopes]
MTHCPALASLALANYSLHATWPIGPAPTAAIVFVLRAIVPSALATCRATDPALFSKLARPDVSYASTDSEPSPPPYALPFLPFVSYRLRVHRPTESLTDRSDSTKTETRSRFHGQHPPCCPLLRTVQSRPSESSLDATLSTNIVGGQRARDRRKELSQ